MKELQGVSRDEFVASVLEHSDGSKELLDAEHLQPPDGSSAFFMDTPESWTKERVLEETENLKNQVMELSLSGKPLKKFNFSKC